MKSSFKNNAIEFLAIIIVFANIFLRLIPILPLIYFLVFLSLYRTRLIGAYYLTSYAMPILLGSALYVQGITGVATLLEVILFLFCLYHWLRKKTIVFYNFKNEFSLLLLVLFIFVVSSCLNTGGDYAPTKLKETTLNGLLVFFAYGFLFCNPHKCNYIRIGLYLILYSFLMLLLSTLLNGGMGPTNFLDFGYLRAQNLIAYEEDKLLVDYQHVGCFATMGLGCIFLESLKKGYSNLFMILCIFLCTIVSLYSGARQSIIISLVLFLLWVFSQRKEGASRFRYLIYLLVGVAIVFFMINFLVSEGGALNSVKEEGYLDASNRGFIMLKSINDFINNPFFGVGFGHFEFYGRYGLYPHNMFVEILCELGIVGMSLLVLVVVKPLKYLLKYEKACVYLFVVYFLRSMTSGGLDSNIMLFSYIFAVLSLKSIKRYNI